MVSNRKRTRLSKLYGCIAPHPPIIVPAVGGAQISKVKKTIEGMKFLSKWVESLNPEVAIVVSPHTPIYNDTFTVNFSNRLSGSLSYFGASEPKFSYKTNQLLAEEIYNSCINSNVPCSKIGNEKDQYELDHGTMVPFYYLFNKDKNLEIVSLTISMLPPKAHYDFGKAIKNAVLSIKNKAIFVASGDLSHRLIPSAPAGYNPMGAKFDENVCEIVKSQNLTDLLEIDPILVDEAGECGLRSFQTLAGYFSDIDYKCKLISYEGPFGVGYMTAYVESK